jgi:hypothetical protein
VRFRVGPEWVPSGSRVGPECGPDWCPVKTRENTPTACCVRPPGFAFSEVRTILAAPGRWVRTSVMFGGGFGLFLFLFLFLLRAGSANRGARAASASRILVRRQRAQKRRMTKRSATAAREPRLRRMVSMPRATRKREEGRQHRILEIVIGSARRRSFVERSRETKARNVRFWE